MEQNPGEEFMNNTLHSFYQDVFITDMKKEISEACEETNAAKKE